MKNKIEVLIKILVFIFISLCLVVIFSNSSYAANQTISSDIENLNDAEYPGIKEKINTLKAKYPNWNFKILYTDLDWDEVITNEYVGHNSSPRNKIQDISSFQGEWICPCGYTDGSWNCASEAAIKYMMDPRNSINESDVFQFEELTNNGYEKSQIDVMTNGTFLQGHSEEIIRAAESTGINPYFIIARLIQEQGKKGTPLTSGVYGYYNPFNIQANGTDPIGNGVVYAQSQGWDTLEKGITGGINFLSKEYIKRGQNTLYLQKFDVENSYQGLYWHQYMQNVTAAQTEGATLRSTYESVNAINASHTFIIPVYKNMPEIPCTEPKATTDATVTGDIVKVNVNSTLCLRNAPNGTKLSTYLYKDEVVTRIEKATTKIAGTYWDKIRKADGTEGYAARETYEYETEYKLYLVPISENQDNENTNGEIEELPDDNTSEGELPEDNNANEENQPVDTDKVKGDKANNVIIVAPDVIAQDILDYYNGSVKIVKADGSYLEGPQSIIGTGYVVADKYTVIKKGDCNGDGKINTADLLTIQKQLLNIAKMDLLMNAAADINNDDTINTADLLAVQKKLLNISDIKI